MKSKQFFIISLIYYIAMISVAIVFALGTAGILTNDTIINILIQIVIVAGIPLILYSLFVSKNPKTTLRDFGFKKLSGKLFLLSCIIALILFVLNIFVSSCFSSILYLFGYEQTIPLLNVGYGEMLKDFFFTACLPGVCEEILHRGMMLNASKKYGYTRYGLIISSLLFGLMHLNINQFFYATILGLLMGISVLATESIWTGVICHFTNNFFSVLFSYDLNTPIHKLYNFLISQISKLSIFGFIVLSTITVLVLLWAFTKIIKTIKELKLKEKSKKLSDELNFENMTEQEAQAKVNQINELLISLDETHNKLAWEKRKPAFIDRLFIIASITLGAVATILTFVAGLI